MIVRVAVIGPAKDFFAVLKENLLGIYSAMDWLEFDNGFEFISHCLNAKKLPDIVFTEMFLLKIDGSAVADYLSTYFPDIRVVFVVYEIDSEIISNVSEAGAVGVVTRSDASIVFKIPNFGDEIFRVKKTTLRDIASLHSIFHQNLRDYRNAIFGKYGITKRESLFLLLNATGLEYGEIAKLMFISKKTVDNMFNSVAKKLGVQNRHNLTLFCIKMKLAKFSTVKTVAMKNILYH